MRIFKVGDTQKAICSNCKAIKNVTFQIRDVPFNDDSGIVNNILVGVCDTCDSVVISLPQSTNLIKEQLEKQREKTEHHIKSANILPATA